MTLLLIVDDDADTRMLLREEFEDHKYFVVCAPDGERALQLLQNHKIAPDVILLDMMMPTMSGAEFLKAKREDPTIAHIPVILCTGLSAEQVRHECGKDVLLVVRKPYVPSAFLHVLEHVRKTGKHKAMPPV